MAEQNQLMHYIIAGVVIAVVLSLIIGLAWKGKIHEPHHRHPTDFVYDTRPPLFYDRYLVTNYNHSRGFGGRGHMHTHHPHH